MSTITVVESVKVGPMNMVVGLVERGPIVFGYILVVSTSKIVSLLYYQVVNFFFLDFWIS